MAEKKMTDFCVGCRKETGYRFEKRKIAKTIRDKEYTFEITVAVCSECGEEMSVPGLIDQNIKEIDEQYRALEGLVTAEDIEKLTRIYNIGKEPLSLALGFGAVTIPRYLDGQVPSKEYSDVIRRALESPAYMQAKLSENRNRISATAYGKAMAAAEELARQFALSPKLLQVISRLFEKLTEITPLALLKLLYFTQGIYAATYGKPLFDEDCLAWVHGPVYYKPYRLFSDFRYNPIDDARFVCLRGAGAALEEEEKEIVDLVAATFGIYGGKALERITHREAPWRQARDGYPDGFYSNEVITKESIREYYEAVGRRYDIRSEEGLSRYIRDMLKGTASENGCISGN